MVVISVYTYGVKIIKKFRWESGFLWGVPWNPPLCTNGSAGYLMQLSVNINDKNDKRNFFQFSMVNRVGHCTMLHGTGFILPTRCLDTTQLTCFSSTTLSRVLVEEVCSSLSARLNDFTNARRRSNITIIIIMSCS